MVLGVKMLICKSIIHNFNSLKIPSSPMPKSRADGDGVLGVYLAVK